MEEDPGRGALEEENGGRQEEENLELPTSGPVRITVTSVSTETGGVQGAADREEEQGEEYVESVESVELPASGPAKTAVTPETGGVHVKEEQEEEAESTVRRSRSIVEGAEEEYLESEESVELPSIGLAVTNVTSGDTETGGVHRADRLEVEEEKTGRRRRSSVKEMVEKIEEVVAVEKINGRDRLMSDRKKKFEKIEIKEQQSVEKRTEAKKKREEKKPGNKIENEQEEDRSKSRRQLTVKEMMQLQLVGRKTTKKKYQ